MDVMAASDATPVGAAALVRRWAHEVCVAPSPSAADIARTLSVDLVKGA